MEMLKNNRGSVLIFVALALATLLVFLGLTLDTGWTTYIRNQGQGRVDAAALAAASGLVNQNAATRQADATARANTFSDQNAVVNATLDPPNTVTPMFYNQATSTLTTAADWTPALCNAVRVTNTVPTPLFLSGIRGVFGGAPETCTNTDGSSGQNCMNNTVSAVGYLGCPGYAQAELPLALCDDAIGFPDECDLPQTYQVPDPTDNSAWTGFTETANAANCKDFVQNPAKIPPVGQEITLNNGQMNACLQEVEDEFCHCFDPTEPQYCGPPSPGARNCCPLVPVVACNPPPGPLNQKREVVGFARMCITGVEDTGSPKTITIALECEGEGTGTTGGECFGTEARNPILAR